MTTATAEPPVDSETSKKPVTKFSHRGVHLSVFANESKNGVFHKVQVESRYKDARGHWQTGHSFDEDQLAVLQDLAVEARRFIRQARAQEKAAVKV